MSADTRRERNEDLAKLASLQAQTVKLIEIGKRSPAQVYALFTSLQYFKENRLAAAVPIPPEGMVYEPEQLQQLLSLRLSDCNLGRGTTLAHLSKKGVEYVGELYLIDWERRKIGKTIYEFLYSIGLPSKLNVAEAKWIPPYVNRDFMWRMNQALVLFLDEHELLNRYEQEFYNRFPYAGDLFSVTCRSWSNYGWGWRLKLISRHLNSGSKLRAGMYCPNWQPPPDPPK